MSAPAMSLNDYQREALRTAPSPEQCLLQTERLAVLALGVAGEAGEVADIIKKVVGHGHPLDREKLNKELGDVLWYVAVLALELGFTLDEVASRNIAKLRARYPQGFSSERSLNRAKEVTP